MTSRHIAALTLFLALLGIGCTNANRRLNAPEVSLEKRKTNMTRATLAAEVAPARSKDEIRVRPASQPTALPADADGVFVGIAISGGGSRSANFAAACMFQLRRFGLLDRVDYISSVSGGSLAAAYYCVSGDDDWNPANVQRKLTHPFANDVIFDTLMPWGAIPLMFTDWDRSDLLAKSFNRVLFSRNGRSLTFADLRPDRPHLLVNATDLQSGKGFVFSNESFDDLNSDLSAYPVAYAVAASSSVPVLMHQVTLRDFSTIFKMYRHLIDGGVTDNLGIQSLVETYEAQIKTAASRGRPNPYPRGAALIVIDAKTNHDVRLSTQGDIGLIESLRVGAGLTSTALLNRASSATMAEIIVQYSPNDVTAQQLRAQIKELEDQGEVTLLDHQGHPVRVVHLALSRAADLSNRPFRSFGDSVNNIATYFNISDAEAYDLYEAADLLVREKFEDRLRQIQTEITQGQPATQPSK